MKTKRNLSLMLTIVMTAAIVGCSNSSDKKEESSTSQEQTVALLESVMESSAESSAVLETPMAEPEETTETIEENDGVTYPEQEIIVRFKTESGTTDEDHYYEILEFENASDNSTWEYKSQESYLGQYNVLNYVVCDNTVLVTEAQQLHVLDLYSGEEITVKNTGSYYNGGSCQETGFAYFQNADGGEVMKVDENGTIIWEIDNSDKEHADGSIGGGGVLEIEGNTLHCYYDFGDYTVIDISKEDGSFINKTSN